MGVFELASRGFKISGIVVDGRQGVIHRLEKIGFLVQMCHFHQIQIVSRYTTRRPRLPAARALLWLVRELPNTDQKRFKASLEKWFRKWEDLLKEKSYDEEKKRGRFTHERLRKAYRSLLKHLPNLFTYLRHKDLPNTTNSLDGSFAHLKDKVRLHRGLSWDRKLKLISELLNGNSA